MLSAYKGGGGSGSVTGTWATRWTWVPDYGFMGKIMPRQCHPQTRRKPCRIARGAAGNNLWHRHVVQVGLTASAGLFDCSAMTSRECTLEGRRQGWFFTLERFRSGRFVKITPCLLHSSVRCLEVIVPHSKRPPEAVRPT